MKSDLLSQTTTQVRVLHLNRYNLSERFDTNVGHQDWDNSYNALEIFCQRLVS